MGSGLRFFTLANALAFPLFAQESFDAVGHGREVFSSMGCVECHVVEKGDKAMKTGPNLYGLFLTKPREREVGPKGDRKLIKADKDYFNKSVRESWDQLAVAESGLAKGATYPQVMPEYGPSVISAQDLESLWHYLRTLADEDEAGPAKVMRTRKKEAIIRNVIDVPGEIPVTDRPRVFRAMLSGTSGRALHVGLPNGMSYTFDPRMLAVRRVWSGGFLNLRQERTGRGKRPSTAGRDAVVFLEDEPLLAPMTDDGVVVDFEFKEPDAQDHPVIEKHLREERDFATKLADLDAEFLGHKLESGTNLPVFQFRVGKNTLTESIIIGADGSMEIRLEGKLVEAQNFQLRSDGFTEVTVDEGVLENDHWKLPASSELKVYHLKARIPGVVVARPEIDRKENFDPQALVSSPTVVLQPDLNRRRRKGKPLAVPAGYSAFTIEAPLDLYGRKQSFEATGIAQAKDGTIVLATRASGIWRIRDDKWTLFAEGTFESLGVCIEDDKGDRIVITQKPELTRLTDTDGDGRADRFETLCDDFGFHGNYHEYTHGPVRDAKGNYHFNLNLADASGIGSAAYRSGGKFMGSMGGYRGWSCVVTPEGKMELFANGLRSPAGMGLAPDGRLWYSENQGEFVGSSKWVPLEKGKFYGHLSGLVDLPGVTPKTGVDGEAWAAKLRKGAVWLPHNKMANSPGNPVWDVTGGKFGVYRNQVFMGDQTLSQLFRVVTERVKGIDQGCAILFAEGLASGPMRPCFLADGSMMIGQTGRGWYATGGFSHALQRIVWDGKTVPGDILRVAPGPDGFEIHFTKPLKQAAVAKSIQVKSWYYTNTAEYGSPEHDVREDSVAATELSDDGFILRLKLKDFGKGDSWLDRIYEISLSQTGDAFGGDPSWGNLQAYFTLRVIPD
ncbi:c-type cytochrome [bacterium]|nr:c-type cytochrome [bacterium]